LYGLRRQSENCRQIERLYSVAIYEVKHFAIRFGQRVRDVGRQLRRECTRRLNFCCVKRLGDKLIFAARRVRVIDRPGTDLPALRVRLHDALVLSVSARHCEEPRPQLVWVKQDSLSRDESRLGQGGRRGRITKQVVAVVK